MSLENSTIDKLRAQLTVLMSVYIRDDARVFEKALLSNSIEQTLVPVAFVLIVDGSLSAELNSVILAFERTCSANNIYLVVHRNEKNVGLAHCLNIGLTKCQTDLVARADADDISMPMRFELQLDAMVRTKSDVVFSYQNEYQDDWTLVTSLKTSPTTHEAIKKALYKRCVVPHSSVLYRKSAVLKINAYSTSVGLLEDYDLHLRMLKAECRYCCVAEPLINVRVTFNQRLRRGGFTYAMKELSIRTRWLREGLIPGRYYFGYTFLYFLFRLSPVWMKHFLYKLVRS